jgi:hypothetical protein
MLPVDLILAPHRLGREPFCKLDIGSDIIGAGHRPATGGKIAGQRMFEDFEAVSLGPASAGIGIAEALAHRRVHGSTVDRAGLIEGGQHLVAGLAV